MIIVFAVFILNCILFISSLSTYLQLVVDSKELIDLVGMAGYILVQIIILFCVAASGWAVGFTIYAMGVVS
jgi:hypothetical protein